MREKIVSVLQKKEIRKDQCLILVLAGILLLVIAWPEKSFEKSEKMDRTDDTLEVTRENQAAEDTNQAYCTYWEEKLAAILSEVQGAGSVKVMVCVSGTEEQVPLKDYESGADRFSEETVYVTNEKGQKVPFVVRTKVPQVTGVLVAAQGAGHYAVEQNIRHAVSALFGLDNGKIMVLPMM